MKPVPLLGLLLLSTACAPQSSPPEALEAVVAAPAAAGYEFTFGFRDGTAADDERIVRIEESPCGDLPVARVTSIPLEDKVLVADPVVEFDEAGKEIGHWGKPNGADVLALDGDRLKFAAGSERYWTDARGAIEKAGPNVTTQGREFLTSEGMFPCPALPTFPASGGSQQCFRVRDAAGRQRLIATEGACS